MRNSQEGVKITIMGKEYTVACPDEKRDELITAASYLDKNMREIKKSGASLGNERLAVMAALNLSHDLLEMRNKGGSNEEVEKRIRTMRESIEATLDKQGEIEL